MNSLKIFVYMMLYCIVATASLADIYEWTDENGVRHYSNYAPADKAKVLMKTKEAPYDEAADRARMEFERQERLELARLELAQREAELELREAEAKRKLAEAERLAQEMLREADRYDDYDEVIPNSRIIYRGGGYWCRDHRHGCKYPVHHRWYYRKKPFRSAHHKYYRAKPHPYSRHVKKKYAGSNKRNFDHKHRYNARSHHTGYGAKYKLNSRAATNHRLNRIGSSGARLNGRGNIGWKRSGFGRRH